MYAKTRMASADVQVESQPYVYDPLRASKNESYTSGFVAWMLLAY